VLVSSACGSGHAALLNLPLKECYLEALLSADPERNGEAVRDLLRLAAAVSDAPPNVTSTNSNLEAALRQTPQGAALLFLINHESRTARTRVSLPHLAPGAIVRDLVSGERVPAGRDYAMNLACPWGETRVLGIFPSDPAGLALQGLGAEYRPGDTVSYTLALGGEQVRGNYLVDVAVTGPDGRRYTAFSALACTENANCRRSFRLPANAQSGEWTISATSLWDGAQAAGSFLVP
jgi:hypothetical protein